MKMIILQMVIFWKFGIKTRFIHEPKQDDSHKRRFQSGGSGLANRNPGMALELMAEDITPVGMHYQLNHFEFL